MCNILFSRIEQYESVEPYKETHGHCSKIYQVEFLRTIENNDTVLIYV